MSDLSVRRGEDGSLEVVTVVDNANLALIKLTADDVRSKVENATNRGDVVSESDGVSSKTKVADLDAYAAEHGIDDYPEDGSKSEKLEAIKAYEGSN